MFMKLFEWFGKRARQDEPEREWWERIGRLEHEMEQLQLSWEETYGKVRRALATLAKRQQREEAGETAEAQTDAEPRAVAAPDASLYAKLRTMYPRR